MKGDAKPNGKGASELYVNMLIDFPKLAVCVLNGGSGEEGGAPTKI
jgi:hypothetical protein